MARERHEQHHERSGNRHQRLEPLLEFWVSSFVDSGARLVGDEVAAHGVTLTDVVVSASDSLQMDLQPILDL